MKGSLAVLLVLVVLVALMPDGAYIHGRCVTCPPGEDETESAGGREARDLAADVPQVNDKAEGRGENLLLAKLGKTP
ncbi:Hypp7832 [Branchiostoma lanceolatum]|uniref:Hypp7832 protein n=1 Tax=Branchiostoma lanceolatum TaxID=7740 RepID=A0A8J9Z4W2_BRALA|nr:Hypp7832 [Branchiostoma lanceolatum]